MNTIAAMIAAALMLLIATFQTLLACGTPWGEWAWSGSHKGVLPRKLRVASLASAAFWIAFAIVVADYGQVVSLGINRSLGHIIVFILTALLAIGTILNSLSPSKKEKLLWTPIAAVCFLACAYLSFFG